MNISVAAQYMMPELELSQVQMGQIFSAFLLGYSLFQIPLGILGDRFGSRIVMATLGFGWAILTILSGYLPGHLFGAGVGAFMTLIVVRFLLGTTIAGVYPVSALAVAKWQPIAQRAFSYSFIVAGVFIGSAMTPPIIAWIMVTFGWRESFYIVSTLSIATALIWILYGADEPEKHKSVSSGELELIMSGRTEEPEISDKPPWWLILKSRSVFLLSLSYFLVGYVLYTFVFWFFTYLVEVRKLTILEGGIYGSLPFIAAGILTIAGGAFCDWTTVRFGRRWGRRIPGLTAPLVAATLLFVGARTEHAALAIATLALSFGFQMFSETAYWSTTMDISGRMTGAATGVLNTANNLGGVVSTALMPVLVEKFGWITALDSCAALAVVAGAFWLLIRPDQPIETEGPSDSAK
jgi:ACS family glucarate transporter-like MFS transporter